CSTAACARASTTSPSASIPHRRWRPSSTPPPSTAGRRCRAIGIPSPPATRWPTSRTASASRSSWWRPPRSKESGRAGIELAGRVGVVVALRVEAVAKGEGGRGRTVGAQVLETGDGGVDRGVGAGGDPPEAEDRLRRDLEELPTPAQQVDVARAVG